MFDTSKLRGRIIEKFGRQGMFAEFMGISQAFLSDVLNGKRYLEQRDIDAWAEALEIDPMEIPIYFFTRKVHETEQRKAVV